MALAELRLNTTDYKFDTLVRIAHRLGQQFSIDIRSEGDDWILTWDVSEADRDASVKRIRNEIYEQLIRDKIHSESKPIRDLIFAAAFSNIKIE